MTAWPHRPVIAQSQQQLNAHFTPGTTKPYLMTLFDIFNILLGFICVQNVFLDIFIFRFPLYSCSSQNSLCLAPPIHLLSRKTVHTLRPATLVETNNKQTHAWHGGCGHCFQQCFQSIPFKSFGRNMITSVLTTR